MQKWSDFLNSDCNNAKPKESSVAAELLIHYAVDHQGRFDPNVGAPILRGLLEHFRQHYGARPTPGEEKRLKAIFTTPDTDIVDELRDWFEFTYG